MPKHQIRQSVREERPIENGRRISLTFHAASEDEQVPAILLLPSAASETTPAPAALLLHGYTSRKERLSDTIGMALLRQGVASLAVDLPLHGERAAGGNEASLRNPTAVVAQWVLALDEATLSLGYLAARREVSAAQLAVVGYSLGSFLGVTLVARDQRVRALVLAAGGDLPQGIPFEPLIRAVVDPMRAVRAMGGRPLLMVHGRRDRTMRPDQARRLFDAAPEPKEMRWWDAGHWLGPDAIEDAAKWVGDTLGAERREIALENCES